MLKMKKQNKGLAFGITAISIVLFLLLGLLLYPRLNAVLRMGEVREILAGGDIDYILVLDPISTEEVLPAEREAMLSGKAADYAAGLLIDVLDGAVYKNKEKSPAGNWDRRVRIYSGGGFREIYLSAGKVYLTGGSVRYVFSAEGVSALNALFDSYLADADRQQP